MLYRSIGCPSRDHNKFEAMNGSVSLAVSISRENFEHQLYSVLLGVQVSVTHDRDYLMFDTVRTHI